MRNRRAEPLDELCQILAMGQIEPASPGHEHLAAEGGHPVVERDREARLCQSFGRHQTGGAAADDGDTIGGKGHGHAMS